MALTKQTGDVDCPQPRSKKNGGRPTAKDVAALAGVSVGTVSRVINQAASVNEEVRQTVLQAIETLNWKPSFAAQNMRGRATRMIGFIFSDLENSLYASMIKGAEDVLTQAGYLLVVGSSNHRPEQERNLIDLFGQRSADGLIFTVTDENDAEVLKSIASAQFPIVMLEREVAVETAGTIIGEHFQGTRHATQYLLSLGHQRIGLICGGKDNRVGKDRIAGFLKAHEEQGVTPDADLIRADRGTAEYAYGFRETQLLLSQPNRPTAIMALGRHLLRGVLTACRQQNIRIPEDLSLITTNDSELAELAIPAITVIRYSAYDMGKEAARLLLQRLNAESAWTPGKTHIPTELILRNSCAKPAQVPLLT